MKSENFLTICAQVPCAEELLLVLLQVQNDVGAARRLLDRLDGEFALAIRLPRDAVAPDRRPDARSPSRLSATMNAE